MMETRGDQTEDPGDSRRRSREQYGYAGRATWPAHEHAGPDRDRDEAQELLAGYLFSVYPIMRVEASTDITNRAEQRALEKAGFTREGVLRKAQWRNGDWHDLVVYSKLRGE